MSNEEEVHLLVLIHGMWGSTANLEEMHRIIRERFTSGAIYNSCSLEIHVAQTNQGKSTYDGIDWGSERIVEEVRDKIREIEDGGRRKVSRFSVTGYSLGGLLARYLIGALHSQRFFEKAKPVNFTTFATPHFGLPAGAQSFREKLVAYLGPILLSRTGEHFFGMDKWLDKGRPLLDIMADENYVFYQALLLFPHVHFYANALKDLTVPFLTAALETSDPFMFHETNGIQIEFDEKYEPIVKSFQLPSSVPVKKSPPFGSKEYMQNIRKKFPRLPLPPPLQFRFPGNVIMTLLFPILFPLLLSFVIFRLSFDMKASRGRIRLLENDPAKANRLVNALRSIEKGMDDVVADIMDDPGLPSSSPSPSESSTPSLHLTPTKAPTQGHTDIPTSSTLMKSSLQSTPSELLYEPKLTPLQHKIIDRLNRLPQLQKHYAFIDKLMNTHATIISRDRKRFAFHVRGEGVLRHWADGFEI
ncbi:hypothetical protein Clacol_005151 [Clathrus columnatus]|uniref:DUF676 domain-containing protein n=1 Tax=Clathrus columnatus TaxID=1419009 RepID=A0AAV5A8G4_9AGAM|nr:hypothetical protein Clacol_005151 [Clathrus columnatus]